MDMFSLGVLLFVMLTGHKPMKSEQARKLAYSRIQAHDYPKMANWTWKRLSKPAHMLVLQLMERNPAKRLTAEQGPMLGQKSMQALKHEWIVTQGGAKPVALTSVGRHANKLGRVRKFHGLANAVIAMNRMQCSMKRSPEGSGNPSQCSQPHKSRMSMKGRHTIMPITSKSATSESETILPSVKAESSEGNRQEEIQRQTSSKDSTAVADLEAKTRFYAEPPMPGTTDERI